MTIVHDTVSFAILVYMLLVPLICVWASFRSIRCEPLTDENRIIRSRVVSWSATALPIAVLMLLFWVVTGLNL